MSPSPGTKYARFESRSGGEMVQAGVRGLGSSLGRDLRRRRRAVTREARGVVGIPLGSPDVLTQLETELIDVLSLTLP